MKEYVKLITEPSLLKADEYLSKIQGNLEFVKKALPDHVGLRELQKALYENATAARGEFIDSVERALEEGLDLMKLATIAGICAGKFGALFELSEAFRGRREQNQSPEA